MSKELIQALKDNERPFGLMTEEMQAKAKELDELGDFLSWHSYHWEEKGHYKFCADYAYRLRPDYTEEPEVVRFPIKESNTGNLCYYTDDSGPTCKGVICLAINNPDFIGFEYEDGNAYADARRYKNKAGCTLTVWRKDYEVLTPTHVLFRSKP